MANTGDHHIVLLSWFGRPVHEARVNVSFSRAGNGIPELHSILQPVMIPTGRVHVALTESTVDGASVGNTWFGTVCERQCKNNSKMKVSLILYEIITGNYRVKNVLFETLITCKYDGKLNFN